MESKNMKAVYTVIEKTEGKSFWLRVGVAFENRDGSYNLKLDALPVNGQLQMREFESKEEREANRFRRDTFTPQGRRPGQRPELAAAGA